ncbi:hypothetical protein Poly24_30610 [Rosistilla carotiformis]|uniref:Uncharacterized protein n=1 Tax=Rosistilla carotiformis TaxID=2528017 RepID=A0A518JV04_9BACT|nr:hypothetical protein [Rosistilla carotiformis]QDV69346.1 hypothetical protein Poly24_30610 [Rosistilla carotiformis]
MFRFLFLLVLMAAGLPAMAAPGSRDPNACLSVHGLCGDSKALVAKCEALWKANFKDVEEINAARTSGRIEEISHQVIARCTFAGTEIEQLAEDLIDMGEPAGFELRIRGKKMWSEAHHGAVFYERTARGQKLEAAAFKALERGTRAREKELQRISELASKGDLEAAAAAYRAAEEKLWDDLLWIHFTKRGPYGDPFETVRNSFQNAWHTERKAASAAKLKEIVASQSPDLEAFSTELTAAIASIGQTGSCDIDGAPATGPEAFGKFFAKWQQAQLGLVRCQGIYWALQNLDAVPKQGHGPWTQTAAEWNTKLLAMLPQLIVADASRATAADAAGLYMRYLDVIAPLARSTQSAALARAVQPPLAQLLKSNPQADALVDRYWRATDDLLTWRGRLAAAQAKELDSSFPALASVFAQANQSSDDYQGLFAKPGSRPTTPTLRISSPELLVVPAPKLLEAQVRANDLTRIPGGGRFLLSGYRDRVFANVPAALDYSPQIAALTSDLLVTESQPPLTLRAAMALDSASQVDLVAIGGTIKGLYLESVIARFASLPSAAAVLFPLPAMPSEGESQEEMVGLNQMMMRFDVMPAWVQHDYFVADLRQLN